MLARIGKIDIRYDFGIIGETVIPTQHPQVDEDIAIGVGLAYACQKAPAVSKPSLDDLALINLLNSGKRSGEHTKSGEAHRAVK